MKILGTIWLVVWLCIGFLLVAAHWHDFDAPVQAQSAQPTLVLCAGAHTTCAIPSGVPSAEIASDGFWYTPNGSNQINLAAGASVTLTINGTTKTLPASFTVTAAAPTVSSASTVTSTAQPPVISAN